MIFHVRSCSCRFDDGFFSCSARSFSIIVVIQVQQLHNGNDARFIAAIVVSYTLSPLASSSKSYVLLQVLVVWGLGAKKEKKEGSKDI